MQRLRRGHYKPRAHLDLHGNTLEQAGSELKAFLHDCLRRGVQCARIVHGKGRGSRSGIPVIKTAVDRWLRRRQEVLAFASAPSFDGGTGAVYVLLRRRVD
jgi:DNA-nicking Smr family endonuclease